MKKLAIVGVFALAACSDANTNIVNNLVPNLTLASEQGAGFGPYTRGEYDARLELNQPGLTQYQEPVNRGRTYEDFRRKQAEKKAAATGNENIDRVQRIVAQAQNQPQSRIKVGAQDVNVATVVYEGQQYAVATSADGRWAGGRAIRAEDNIRRQLPQIVGCKSDGTTEAVFGSGTSAQLVFGVNCS